MRLLFKFCEDVRQHRLQIGGSRKSKSLRRSERSENEK